MPDNICIRNNCVLLTSASTCGSTVGRTRVASTSLILADMGKAWGLEWHPFPCLVDLRICGVIGGVSSVSLSELTRRLLSWAAFFMRKPTSYSFSSDDVADSLSSSSGKGLHALQPRRQRLARPSPLCPNSSVRLTAHDSATLIDNLFCKLNKPTHLTTAGILLNKLSDHQPCFILLDTDFVHHKHSNYIKIYKQNDEVVENIKYEISNSEQLNKIDIISDCRPEC